MTPERVDSDRPPTDHQPYEYVIVGGGIHGTCLANFLVTEGGYARGAVRIVEPREELLTSFATKARQCGMRTLRSPFVQHIDTEPFSLESYAEGAGREDELVSTDGHPSRPTLDLFLDHARWVVDRRGIGDCHLQARVTDITDRDDGLRVETPERTLDADRVVLALGLGADPTIPDWATSLPADAPVDHVWDEGFDPTPATMAATLADETYVVGGGITAAQLACSLSERTSVTLLSRHELEIELTEADPRWLNWKHVEREIHGLPPGSESRHDRIRTARNDATVPPYVERRLADARDCDGLDVRRGEISCAYATEEGLLVRFDDGTTAANVRVILATGLDPVPSHPLVGTVAESLSLERGANGFPVLDDRTLAWRRADGSLTNVYVSGALAEPTTGPFARNVVGARRVAERLLANTTRVDSERSTVRSGGTS